MLFVQHIPPPPSSSWVFRLAQREEFRVRLQRRISDSSILNWNFLAVPDVSAASLSVRRVSQRERAGVYFFCAILYICLSVVFFFLFNYPKFACVQTRLLFLYQDKNQCCQSDWIIIHVAVMGRGNH